MAIISHQACDTDILLLYTIRGIARCNGNSKTLIVRRSAVQLYKYFILPNLNQIKFWGVICAVLGRTRATPPPLKVSKCSKLNVTDQQGAFTRLLGVTDQ